VFDKRHAWFIDFVCFGVLGTGRQVPARALLPLLTAAWAGCSSPRGPARVEDSLTSGRITVACTREARPVVDRELAAFVKLYPQAEVRVVERTSRDAVRALFAAQCDASVMARDLRPEERGAAARGGLEIEGYRFAKDAIVVVVHPSNPVENLALDDLRRIYEGRIKEWTKLGGSAAGIEPVIPPAESDVTEFLVERVMGGEPIRAPVLYESSDSGVVAAVARRTHALGFVSMTAGPEVKRLRLSGLAGLPYWTPDLEAVHRGDYPLTRYLNFYLRPSGPRLASGLITFVTSIDGQRIVRETGLVPTSVPVRFVRRSAMRSGHAEERRP
jgi:phosphate transport system substrate-binding protein